MIISSISLMVITDVPGLLTTTAVCISILLQRHVVDGESGSGCDHFITDQLMEVSGMSVSHCRVMLEPRRAYTGWEGQT